MSKETKEVAEYAKRLLEYNPHTGILRWIGHKQMPYRSIAGCKNKRGYIQIYLKNKPFPAHRVAWLLSHGEWPSNQIDHINGNRVDNRLGNLRLATNQQNSYNRGAQRNNSLGLKGVKTTRGGRFSARINAEKKSYFLGVYDTPEQAQKAYQQAAKVLHEEFSR